MVRLTALMDGEEEILRQLGVLRPIEKERSRPVKLKKRITVNNLGSYIKRLTTPLYNKQAVNSYALQSPEFSFDAAGCLGVLCDSVNWGAHGYVARYSSGHRFCLPVYSSKAVPRSFYKTAGYMVTDQGYLVVVKRRWLLWLVLGLLSGIIFVLSYLLFRYGPADAWSILIGWLETGLGL